MDEQNNEQSKDVQAPENSEVVNTKTNTNLEPEKSEPLTYEELTLTNARLLKESTKNKEKYLSAYKQLDENKKAELDKQGKESERAKYYQEKYESLNKKLLTERIDKSVVSAATKANCVDPDSLLAIGSHIGLSDLIQYDETTGQVFGVDQFVDELKKQKPKLFSSQTNTVINSSVPGTTVVKIKEDKPVNLYKDTDKRRQLLSQLL